MNPTTTIPVVVTPEVAARVAELGMQRELQQMLDHALQTIPGLRSIEVVLALPYDTGDETSITIEAMTNVGPSVAFPAEDRWSQWRVDTFPPEIWSHIRLFVQPGTIS